MKTILRTVAVIIAATFTFNASAQLPDNGVWPPGVTYTDLNGVIYDVDSILDLGHPIFIDAYATWCPPCWSYSQSGALDDLYTQYGPNGTDELVVFGIESDPSTTVGQISTPISPNDQGDWTAGTTYPMINDDNIANMINLAYYPTIIRICPDRTVTEVGQKPKAVLFNGINSCNGPASSTNDPKLIANKSQSFFCSGGTAEIAVVLQNNSTAPITSATIEVFDGSTSVATKNWTGNLASYATKVVTIGDVSPTSSTTYNIKITSANDDVSNDEVTALVQPAPQLMVGQNSKEVTFDLNIDNFASEIGIIFDEGQIPTTDWPTLYSSVNSNPSSVIGFSKIGTYTDGTNHIEETWTVNNEGCYYAAFLDNYGDGYVYQTPNATIDIKGIGSSSISIDPNFGQGTYKIFDVVFEDDVSLNTENMVSQFNLYPNPATNLINVDFELQNENNVIVSILNTVGQTVASKKMDGVSGEQNIQFNTSNLEAGMYLVKIKTKNGEQIKRLSVVK